MPSGRLQGNNVKVRLYACTIPPCACLKEVLANGALEKWFTRTFSARNQVLLPLYFSKHPTRPGNIFGTARNRFGCLGLDWGPVCFSGWGAPTARKRPPPKDRHRPSPPPQLQRQFPPALVSETSGILGHVFGNQSRSATRRAGSKTLPQGGGTPCGWVSVI